MYRTVGSAESEGLDVVRAEDLMVAMTDEGSGRSAVLMAVEISTPPSSPSETSESSSKPLRRAVTWSSASEAGAPASKVGASNGISSAAVEGTGTLGLASTCCFMEALLADFEVLIFLVDRGSAGVAGRTSQHSLLYCGSPSSSIPFRFFCSVFMAILEL